MNVVIALPEGIKAPDVMVDTVRAGERVVSSEVGEGVRWDSETGETSSRKREEEKWALGSTSRCFRSL